MCLLDVSSPIANRVGSTKVANKIFLEALWFKTPERRRLAIIAFTLPLTRNFSELILAFLSIGAFCAGARECQPLDSF